MLSLSRGTLRSARFRSALRGRQTTASRAPGCKDESEWSSDSASLPPFSRALSFVVIGDDSRPLTAARAGCSRTRSRLTLSIQALPVLNGLHFIPTSSFLTCACPIKAAWSFTRRDPLHQLQRSRHVRGPGHAAECRHRSDRRGAYDCLMQPVQPSVLRRVVGEALDVAGRIAAGRRTKMKPTRIRGPGAA